MFNINMFANYKYGFIAVLKNSIDPDQLASNEASRSESILFSKEVIECKNVSHAFLFV